MNTTLKSPRFPAGGISAPQSRPQAPRDGAIPPRKRALDLAIIVLAAPVLVPVMAGIALLVKSLSSGPALFRQTRIGLNGAPFECFKFRTMHVNAPTGVHEQHVAALMKADAPMTKLDAHDPRLFPLARLLRATGLDELPQVLNVLRGEMSLVGPRPSTPGEYAGFTPAQRRRTDGLPGLTGLWQVNGKNRTTFTQMIELDLHYLRSQGLWLDLGILLRTPFVLVREAASCLRPTDAATPAASRPARPVKVTGRYRKASHRRARTLRPSSVRI